MKYSVWVGGGEVNKDYLTYIQAYNLAEEYISDGYDDVQIEEMPLTNTHKDDKVTP